MVSENQPHSVGMFILYRSNYSVEDGAREFRIRVEQDYVLCGERNLISKILRNK